MRYTNLKYWDGISDSLIEGDISTADELFAEEGGSDSVDLSGCYAIPGLIDAHIHLCLTPEIKDPNEQTIPARDHEESPHLRA